MATIGTAMNYTIIIPTLALPERADMLRRAISSAREGNLTATEFVVVVNGSRYSPALVDELRTLPQVRVLRLEQPGSAGAILAGRRAVRTTYFSYLDDDDQYLPGSVDARVAALQAVPEADLVVCNGFRRSGGVDRLALQHVQHVPADPLESLFVENWMPSCGPAFRTSTVPESAFEALPRHIHWSFLAFTLAMMGKKVTAIDRPCFVINDTPDSASKQESYLLCHIEVYERMLASKPPPHVRGIVARRLASAFHEASDYFRVHRRLREAWRMHLRSLFATGGASFLPYTRHLVVIHRRSVE